MYRIFLCLVILSTFCLTSAAQQQNQRDKYIKTASSPKGNYIFLFSPEDLLSKDSLLPNSTASFTLERYESVAGNFDEKSRQTMKAAGVSSSKDLAKYFTTAEIDELRNLYGLSSNDALAEFFATHKQIADYPMLYDKIEIREALGAVYLDENVDSGKLYTYRITRVDKQGISTPYGFTFAQAKSGNYLLSYFKPVVTNIYTTDSAAIVTWQMPVDVNMMFTTKPPVSPMEGDESSFIYRMPFSPLSTRANVYAEETGSFKKIGIIAPSLNKTNDTLTYSYSRAMSPDQQLTVFLQTEDIVYNPGIFSDTAVAFTVDKKNMPLIQVIHVRDTLNAVAIKWDKFDIKPYISGIEIKRYNSRDEMDSLATLPVTDTMYMDYKVELGQTYRYQVKLIYDQWLKFEQEIPAQGAGAFTKFGRPLPVSNLAVANINGMPKLTWTTTDDPAYFGAYIYRGTAPEELSLIAGPIKDIKFTDSASHLTARNPYYYAVMAQNLRQDTSILSEVVSIVPDKQIETAGPSSIDFYYFNDTLRISWNDVRANDNSIEKFLVLRSIGKDEYKPMTEGFTDKNYVNDIGVRMDEPYNYKVAAISVRGDTSEYSPAYTYTLPALPIDQVELFTIRSTSEGVQVSLPTVSYQDRKAYNIYRREATQTDFKKLGSIQEGTYDYMDKTAKNNMIYVYGISIVNLKGEEGARGKSISLRYEKGE